MNNYIYVSPTVDKQLTRIFGSSSSYENWKNNILKMLDQPGVVYIGPVDHKTLEQAFKESGFL